MRLRLLFAVLLLVSVLPGLPAAAEEPPEPEWAPVAEATIRPGVGISSESGGCTSNFIFYEAQGEADEVEGPPAFDIFIGVAAHCFGTGGSTGTNGCTTGSRELGAPATVGGADHPGELAYSSWVTMQDVDEGNNAICGTNDFALVKLDPRDHDKVNPTLQYFGGPTGLRTSTTGMGDEVYSYGNSSLRFGISQLSPKRGWSTGTASEGWSHRIYTVTPGVPGDSGSAFVDDTGSAMGVVVTLQIAPFAGSNGVTDLAKALDYANEHTDLQASLALGTEPFTDPILP